MSHDRVDPIRGEGPIFGEKRRRVVAACDRLTSDLADVDRQIDQLTRRRRELAAELKAHRRRLWPTLSLRGRAARRDGAVQLPPVQHGATWLRGRRLRLACRAILARVGAPLSLVELHVMLHRHQLAVQSGHPVKALADALGYDVDGGRCRRVGRGVYELDPAEAARIPTRLWPGGPVIGLVPPD